MPLGRSWLDGVPALPLKPSSGGTWAYGMMANASSISGAHGEASSLRRKKGHCSGVVQVTALGVREVPRLPWPRIHASCSDGPSLPIYGESSSEARSAGSASLSLLKAHTGRSSSDTVSNP